MQCIDFIRGPAVCLVWFGSVQFVNRQILVLEKILQIRETARRTAPRRPRRCGCGCGDIQKNLSCINNYIIITVKVNKQESKKKSYGFKKQVKYFSIVSNDLQNQILIFPGFLS